MMSGLYFLIAWILTCSLLPQPLSTFSVVTYVVIGGVSPLKTLAILNAAGKVYKGTMQVCGRELAETSLQRESTPAEDKGRWANRLGTAKGQNRPSGKVGYGAGWRAKRGTVSRSPSARKQVTG